MIYIVSYPKCGRTWFRTIISQYEKLSKSKAKEYKFTHLGFGLDSNNDVLKEILSKGEDRLLINISRDPLDVLVSYYDDTLKRGKGKEKKQVKENTIDQFCIEQTERYLEFSEIIKQFDFDYSMTYEGMKKNTLKQILPAFEILFDKVDIDKLEAAIEFCQFDNLSELERAGKIDMRSNRVKGYFKTRKGKIGSHKEELKPETIKAIRKKLESKL